MSGVKVPHYKITLGENDSSANLLLRNCVDTVLQRVYFLPATKGKFQTVRRAVYSDSL